MRFSVEPSDKINVKGYGSLSFAKNIGTHGTRVVKNMRNTYSQ